VLFWWCRRGKGEAALVWRGGAGLEVEHAGVAAWRPDRRRKKGGEEKKKIKKKKERLKGRKEKEK
jgi:hypothetical protein